MCRGVLHCNHKQDVGHGWQLAARHLFSGTIPLYQRLWNQRVGKNRRQDDIQANLNGIKDGLADLSFMAVGRSAENDNVVKATKPSRAIQTTVILVGLGIIFIVIKRGRTNQLTPKE